MQIWLDSEYKSLKPFSDIALPDFVVLSGQNGAGKSHLLQGIAEARVKGDWGGDSTDVRMLTSAELGNPPELNAGGESREQIVARFESTVFNIKAAKESPQFADPVSLNRYIIDVLANVGVSVTQREQLEDRAAKPILEWDHDDFVTHTPPELDGDLFAFAVGEIFGRYNYITTANALEELREAKGLDHGIIRTESDIIATFGRPPWELLNVALTLVSLPYRFEAPEISMIPLASPPKLRHETSHQQYPVSALSSGEKTLLSIALTAYSASNRRDYLKLPQIVLLDEPDATLHPSMIRSLLELLQQQFVEELGIKVIITTHSPTTVALAPDGSLFVMDRATNPRIKPAVSKDSALSSLLVGVPTLSVSSDNRRIIIVESPYDERRYTEVSRILADELRGEISLVFMAAGSVSLPNGSAAVLDLVSRLRSNGNKAVWGLVDRDNLTAFPSDEVIYNPERYTSENFFLDPLAVGLFLLLENFQPATRVLTGINFVNFDPSIHAQTIVDYVTSTVGANGKEEVRDSIEYVGGFKIEIPRFWLNEPGHKLTNRLPDNLPLFTKFARDPERLLTQVVERIWASRPGLIPKSILDTLKILIEKSSNP